MNSIRGISLTIGAAVLLTLLFWGPLWCGYGFIGGDLYPYFFPQKAFLSDRLHAGEFPLWNHLTGFGYPVLGESQTGAAYPPYLLSYYLLDVNTAYNVIHLLHYVLCFLGTWLFAVRIGLRTSAAVLTAVVFTYGWFPPRACLEWAIVTGAWMPLALWCVESFVQTRWWRYAIGLSFVLGLQLLAGHFHLAFITQLVVLSYACWRSLSVLKESKQAAESSNRQSIVWIFGPLLVCTFAGFLLAAVQLVPAWELKTRSSRATVGVDHEPSYGHLPPLYASQMIAPWLWYSPLAIDGDETIRTFAEFGAPWHWFGPHRDLDDLLMNSRAGGLTSIATNKVEAHLYCGLIPLAFAILWTAISLGAKQRGRRQGSLGNRQAIESNSAALHRGETWFWLIAGGLALVYATGWLLPITRLIPGFNFFRGPGRYGIVTTLAVAVLSGRGLMFLLENRSAPFRGAVLTFVLWSTVGDLWLVSRMVTYAVMVSRPPIQLREHSPVRKILVGQEQPARLYAPGQNLGNLLGVSCLPVYLGIAPAEYSDRKFAGDGMPKAEEASRDVRADAEFSKWLRECGVTHIMSFQRLDMATWQVDEAWHGIDPLLNSAWGRAEPIYLYRLWQSPGRVSLMAQGEPSRDGVVTTSMPLEANRFTVNSHASLEATLVARELAYPGWTVEVDGRASASSSQGAFREVSVPTGDHTIVWVYRPWSVKFGMAVSVGALLMLATIGHIRFWHRGLMDSIAARLMGRR